MKQWRQVFLGAAVVLGAATVWAKPPEPVWQTNVYRAVKMKMSSRDLDLAKEKYQTAWDFSNGTSNNITYVTPSISNLKIADGALKFQTASNTAMLAWGNYENRQPLKQRRFLWPNWNLVEIKVKQSAATSDWTLALTQDGLSSAPWRPNDRTAESQSLTGTAWQTLAFRVQLPNADGFTLLIKGPENNAIEIQSIRVLSREYVGYYRRNIEVPKGRVWQAVAEVGCKMRLFVNGKEIPFQIGNDVYFATTPVDLAPYLKRGRNTVAMELRSPVFYKHEWKSLDSAKENYLQGRIVMDSGEVITLDTVAGWKASECDVPNWTRAEFDDSAWKPAEAVPKFHTMFDEFHRRFPAYDGRLVLENPSDDPKLFFDAARPLKVRVRVPAGLKQAQPAVQWILRRAADEPGTNSVEQDIGEGKVSSFVVDSKTASLVYEVDAGQQPRGVYTLEVSLHQGGQVLERRAREPLVVVGKIPMPEVKGTNYEDGLKLTLEDTIEFANPQDPHPWVESEAQEGKEIKGVATPKIVEKNGLKYRETTPGRGAAGVMPHFTYQFAFQKPRSFYLMVLEYPDDADRCIGVSIETIEVWGSRDPKIIRDNQTGPAVITGFKYPTTGRMRELRWLHYAYTRDQVVDVVSLAKAKCGAAARLKIYRVEGELPAVKIAAGAERWLGIHTERAGTMATLYNGDDPGYYQLIYLNKLHLDMVGHATQRLKYHMEGCENYARYLRFSGQNLHVMGAYQYNEHNNSYFKPERIATSRVPVTDVREMALRVLGGNDITLMSMLEYCVEAKLSNRTAPSDGQVALGEDTVFPVSRDGKQAGGAGCVSQANYDHPLVQASYLQVIDDLAYKFAFSPAWNGVYLMTFPTFSGPVTYAPKDNPFDYDYSDATIAAFEREAGVKVPIDPQDPKRFEKRYAFLTSEIMKAKWCDWRAQTVRRLVLKTRDNLRKYRPDLQVMYGYYMSGELNQAWYQSGRGYRDFMRDYGWDPTLFAKDKDIWTGRYFFPNTHAMLAGTYNQAAAWEQEVGKDPIAVFDRDDNRLVVFNTCWHEVELFAPGSSHVWDGKEAQISLATNWPVPQVHVRYVSQPNNDNALECFSQAMIGADPEMIMFGFTDAMLPMGYEQELRMIARVLLPLPKAKFQSVQGSADFQHNLAIRELKQGKDYWFYVANPGYWPIRGRIVLSGKAALVDPATGEAVPAVEENGKTVVPVVLGGYGLAAFKAPGGERVSVEAWTNEPLADSALQKMHALIAEADSMIAVLEVAAVISADERAFVRDTLAKAKADLQAGEYARAWSRLTNRKFWNLVKDHLAKATLYAARIPGYEPVERKPDSIPALAVAKAAQPPVIDGKLDDSAWKDATFTEGFLCVGFQGGFMGLPFVATAAKAAYDSQNLYLGFVMAEKTPADLKKNAVAPEEILNGWDDAIAFFLQPDGVKIFQMAVNPAGLRYQADATGQLGGYFRRYDKELSAWQAAAGVADTGWTVEVAIPYATLKAAAPHAGDCWKANFLRRYRNFMVPEMYWSMIKNSWYDTSRYGSLKF